MKKLLCFLAALVMLFGISAHAQDKTELYASLGIVLPEDAKDPVTRGDFAQAAATLIPNAELYKEELPFYDVSENSKYYSAVSCLYANSIINGTGQNLYSPDNNITSNEACAILVRILGFDFMADGKYQNTATELGLLKGVSFGADGSVSKEAARRMIFNALETEIGKYYYKNGALKVDLSNKQSYLERCFGVYEISGVVNDNGKTSLYGKSTVASTDIIIGSEVYKNESGKDYFACEVNAWYVEENDENVIKYMELKHEDAVVEFNAKDIDGFSNGSYNVFEGTSKTKTYRVSDNYKIIYNERLYSGKYTAESLQKVLCPEIGSVRLIDSGNDGKYDVIFVKSYETFVVSGTVEETMSIIDKIEITEGGTKKAHSIDLKEIDELVVKNSDGARRDFTNILVDEVVSVAVSADKTYAEVIISENKMTGSDISVNGEYITIDGTEYYMTELYQDYMESYSVVRLINAKFYLDFEGNIAFHEMSLDNGTVAYLINYFKRDDEGVALKVVTEDNELKRINLAEKVVIDGAGVKQESQYERISEKQYKNGYLINYRENENGEITKIDFPYYQTIPAGKDAQSFHIIDGYENVSEKLKSSRLGNALALESDTKVWIVPQDKGDDQITVLSPSASGAGAYGGTVSVTAYSYEEYPLSTKYVVVSDKKTAGMDITKESWASNQKPMIVKKISQAYKNDEVVNCFVFSDGGQYTEVYSNSSEVPKCMKSGKPVRVGDMIRYGTDKSGAIDQSQIIIMYSPEDDEVGKFNGMYYNDGNFDNATHTVNAQGVGIIYGWVNAKNSKYVEVSFNANPATQTIKKSDKTLWSLGAMNVTVYDRKTKEVSIGTTDEIMAYRDTGVGTKLVMHIFYDNPNMVYVIKED